MQTETELSQSISQIILDLREKVSCVYVSNECILIEHPKF